jgi:hypothetical protein
MPRFAALLILCALAMAPSSGAAQTCEGVAATFREFARHIIGRHDNGGNYYYAALCLTAAPEALAGEVARSLELRVLPTLDLRPPGQPEDPYLGLSFWSGIQFATPEMAARFWTIVAEYLAAEPALVSRGGASIPYGSAIRMVIIYRPGSKTALALLTGHRS